MAACAHAVQLYECDSDLTEAVGSHLAEGLSSGGAAIAIATERHRRAFEAALEAEGANMASFTSLDAEATLACFCTDGRIDRDGFKRVIGGIVRDAATGGGPVQTYGEMVALLWDAGHVPAAIELEELWNDLGRELGFSLLCGYHLDSVAGAGAALHDVCRLHTSVETTSHFGAVREAPRAARDFVAEALRRRGAAAALLLDAQLVVSELATNAIRHARSRFSVAVWTSGAVVRIAVRDDSAMPPVRRDPRPAEGSGRGIALIQALASDWGTEIAGRGKTVWPSCAPEIAMLQPVAVLLRAGNVRRAVVDNGDRQPRRLSGGVAGWVRARGRVVRARTVRPPQGVASAANTSVGFAPVSALCACTKNTLKTFPA